MKIARKYSSEVVKEALIESMDDGTYDNTAKLMVEEYAKQKSIDFTEWTHKFNWVLKQHPTDANQKVWVKSYWSFYDINVWRTTDQLYDLFIDYEALEAPTEPTH
jgi:hypothetical protein